MSEITNDPELNGLELALGGLSPVPARLDRDRLMFQAGAIARRRAERARWAWPSVAAVLSLVITGQSILLASRPATRVVERVVVIREPSGSTPSPPAPIVILSQVDDPTDVAAVPNWETVSAYHRRQDLVLRFGLDAFPEPVRGMPRSGGSLESSAEDPISAGALRRIELEKLNNPGDHS